MEALGDAIILGEAPHACQLLLPDAERPAELLEGIDADLFEIRDLPQQQRDQPPALPCGACLLQQKSAQALLEDVDRLDGGVFAQVRLQA